MNPLRAGVLVSLLGAVRLTAAEPSLEAAFDHPPQAAKPRTWWHWIGGNISKPGITADLEAMQRVGIGGAQIFTAAQSALPGPVLFMTPEWREDVQFAFSEAKRLGLEMTLENCEGWSEAGGPWITPAESMQQVVWTETAVRGGETVALRNLPRPWTEVNYYEDIALAAFPASATEPLAERPWVSTSPGATISPIGRDGRRRPLAVLQTPTWDAPQWILLTFSEAREFSSAHVGISPLLWREAEWTTTPTRWEIQASDDGHNFRHIGAIGLHGTLNFAPIKAKYFRLWMPTPAIELPTSITITEFEMGGQRVDKAEARSGEITDLDVDHFTNTAAPASAVIPKQGWIDLTGKTEWNAPAGNWIVLRLGHTSTNRKNSPAQPQTEGLEADKLSRAAITKHFEQGVLGPVIAESGAMAGQTFKYVLCDSWETGDENWTPLLPEEFKQRRGYDLHPYLPALAGRIVGSTEETERFLWDYRRTLADLLAENYYGTLQTLAHQHGMGLYAEATGIHIPTIADQLLCKSFTDVPMGEFWLDMTWGEDDTKEAASAAHLYGRPIAAAESFTAYPFAAGWARDPYSLKAQGDREFCQGINQFVFHRFAHQPWSDRKPGMSLWLWGTQFDRTNTWWEPGAAYMSYVARSQAMLQRGRFDADLCYYYGEGVPVDVEAARLSPEPPKGYDYDVCSTDVLMNLMTVKDGRIVLPSGMSYRVLVLPQNERMTLPVLRKLEQLVHDGATVFGPKPTRSPSLADYGDGDRKLQEIADEVWGDQRRAAASIGHVRSSGTLVDALQVPADFQSTVPSMRFIHRTDGDAEIYFVSDQETASLTALCTFRVSGKTPELWYPDTGRRETAALFTAKDGSTRLPIHFDPIGSVFVVFHRPAAPSDAFVSLRESQDLYAAAQVGSLAAETTPPVKTASGVVLTAEHDGSYELISGNGQRVQAEAKGIPSPTELVGPWQISFPSGLGAPAAATFDRLKSWIDDSNEFGIRYFSGTATYRLKFGAPAEVGRPLRRWVLDLGVVKNLADVSVNGKRLGILWKEPFRMDVTDVLRPGENELLIKVTNLWPNRMIGDQLLPPAKRITWLEYAPYQANSPLLPSGLIGPVRLVPQQRVEFSSAGSSR